MHQVVLYTRDGCSLCVTAKAAILAVRRDVDFSALHGKTVLVNFWATWCPPCREEMPSLSRLAQQFDPGTFEVVAVSVDEGWAPVEKFLAQPRTPFRVVLDEGAKISRTYGTTKFPASSLPDRDGKLRRNCDG